MKKWSRNNLNDRWGIKNPWSGKIDYISHTRRGAIFECMKQYEYTPWGKRTWNRMYKKGWRVIKISLVEME